MALNVFEKWDCLHELICETENPNVSIWQPSHKMWILLIVCSVYQLYCMKDFNNSLSLRYFKFLQNHGTARTKSAKSENASEIFPNLFYFCLLTRDFPDYIICWEESSGVWQMLLTRWGHFEYVWHTVANTVPIVQFTRVWSISSILK